MPAGTPSAGGGGRGWTALVWSGLGWARARQRLHLASHSGFIQLHGENYWCTFPSLSVQLLGLTYICRHRKGLIKLYLFHFVSRWYESFKFQAIKAKMDATEVQLTLLSISVNSFKAEVQSPGPSAHPTDVGNLQSESRRRGGQPRDFSIDDKVTGTFPA